MKPWLLLPPKLAHDLAPIGIRFSALLRVLLRKNKIHEWHPMEWRGLKFANPLGIAGGVDKDGTSIDDWWAHGPGFIEIGTVTPLPQKANPGKIIDRDLETKALWNRMGFPGSGAQEVQFNLRDIADSKMTPIFVNIGKNRFTPNDQAAQDYVKCIQALDGLADAFVVNISSPNTSGLRDLFQADQLGQFLLPILSSRRPQVHSGALCLTPVLLKLSPDLKDAELKAVIETACEVGIDGFIATNTTLARELHSRFPNEGGVSGRPLATHSKDTLEKVLYFLGSRRSDKLIVSTGGVMTAEDVAERLRTGADLVQFYTALVFEGPSFFDRTLKQLAKMSGL